MSGYTPAGSPSPLNHANIGQIQGKYGKGVIQYLGIQYATLADRFADPKLVEPPVVLPPHSAQMEMGFIQKQLPVFDVPDMSDLDGLNLNITVPFIEHQPTNSSTNFPVLVYVHGGGFAFGSSTYPHYDQSKVVELSVIMDQPVVAVNFNYRLGIPGFLTSEDMRAQGYSANRGLLDQKAAIQWVKKHIGGFGGDPTRITVAGQSAGAASVQFLMHDQEALFHQALLLGGSFLMMKPGSEEAAEPAYKKIGSLLGLDPAGDQVQQLLAVPKEQLVSEGIFKEMASLGPIVDGKTIAAAASFSVLERPTPSFPLPGLQWCKRLYSIDSQYDGTIFAQVNLNFRKDGIAQNFTAHVHAFLGNMAAASQLLQLYGIDGTADDEAALAGIVQFITDIAFYTPSVKIAASWPPGKGRSALVGHFNEHNPFEGPYEGKANHLLDIAFLWGNYNQSYKQQNWTVGRALAESVVRFVAQTDQQEPTPGMETRGLLPLFSQRCAKAAVFGPSDSAIATKTVDALDCNETGRSDAIWTLAESVDGGLDTLLDLAHSFLRG